MIPAPKDNSGKEITIRLSCFGSLNNQQKQLEISETIDLEDSPEAKIKNFTVSNRTPDPDEMLIFNWESE
jgi:hypothetical protein